MMTGNCRTMGGKLLCSGFMTFVFLTESPRAGDDSIYNHSQECYKSAHKQNLLADGPECTHHVTPHGPAGL